MTAIVSKETKKALKEAIMRGENVYIDDPAFINPNSFFSNEMAYGTKVVVTNHPKRSYFATIERKSNGEFIVT